MTRIRRATIDWPEYLTSFHAQRPGITEAVLERCTHNGRNPYEWLLDETDPTARILDLACGSAPTRPTTTSRWIGIDRSSAELAVARSKHSTNLVLGDGLRLPFRDDTFDVVVCAMALMLIAPLGRALREITRVLDSHGALHVLLPATSPVTWADRVRFARMVIALRTRPQFPATPLTRTARDAFAQGGLMLVHDERRRYDYPIDSTADADRFVDSLYLPSASPHQIDKARNLVRRWQGHSIGIPLRSITCTPRPTGVPYLPVCPSAISTRAARWFRR